MTDGIRFLTIPRNNPVNSFTMGGIVRDAGLTVEEFRDVYPIDHRVIDLLKKHFVVEPVESSSRGST